MMQSAFVRAGLALLAVTVLACGDRDSDETRVPLGQGPPVMTGEARVALDSANLLFRARAYDQALAQYERSAQLAPRDLTPLLGVMMVAEATGDTALARRTRERVREVDPEASIDTTAAGHTQLIDVHSQVAPASPHP